jgi:hypothetical protein
MGLSSALQALVLLGCLSVSNEIARHWVRQIENSSIYYLFDLANNEIRTNNTLESGLDNGGSGVVCHL